MVSDRCGKGGVAGVHGNWRRYARRAGSGTRCFAYKRLMMLKSPGAGLTTQLIDFKPDHI